MHSFKNVLITGGAGFIGSHIVDHFMADESFESVTVLDKITYAADWDHISAHINNPKFKLVVGDLVDQDSCNRALKGVDLVIHAAAESHVDNSFQSSLIFTKTNVLGTHTLLQCARESNILKFIHISTDEVYGETKDGSVKEDDQYNPTNPYSASKAAAEMIVNGYIRSFDFPASIVRANNMYGIRQFPEKLIPRSILRLLCGKDIQLHGDGKNYRTYLSVIDFCQALELISKNETTHEIYNVGSEEEYTNLQIAEIICEKMNFQGKINFVSDRPFNDCRYSIDYGKIEGLGWHPKASLISNLDSLVEYYKKRRSHYESIL